MKSHDLKGPKPMVRTRKSGWAGKVLSAVLVAGTISPLVIVVASMEGCKKKAPPPVVVAPPPQTAPPPPENVDLKALSQSMKVDRRVSIGTAAKTSEEGLARGVMELADALARGDDKKFGEMVDPASRSLVKGLVTSGRWAETTKKIEAVRIARIMAGAEAAPVEANPDIEDYKRLAGANIMAALPDEVKTAIKTELGHDPDLGKIEDMRKVIEAMLTHFREKKEAGTLSEVEKPIVEQLERGEKLLAADKGADKPADTSSGERYTVTLAVQQPGSAFAMGWVATNVGGKWVFSASSVPQAQNMPRASDFDAVFSEGGETSADSSTGTPSGDKPADPAKPASDSSSKSPTGG